MKHILRVTFEFFLVNGWESTFLYLASCSNIHTCVPEIDRYPGEAGFYGPTSNFNVFQMRVEWARGNSRDLNPNNIKGIAYFGN